MLKFVESLARAGMRPDQAVARFFVGREPDFRAWLVKLVKETGWRAVTASKLTARLEISVVYDIRKPRRSLFQVCRLVDKVFAGSRLSRCCGPSNRGDRFQDLVIRDGAPGVPGRLADRIKDLLVTESSHREPARCLGHPRVVNAVLWTG